MDFPQTMAALAVYRPLFKAQQELGMKPGFDQREERVVWQRANLAAEAGYAAVLKAYADEVLPAILTPGPWRQCTMLRAIPSGERRREEIIHAYYALFDHGETFRKQSGTKNWHCTAIIGQPYPRDEIADAARFLASRHPVSVWARDDLSGWFPGWTKFIVAADRYYLKPEMADEFGFTVLA